MNGAGDGRPPRAPGGRVREVQRATTIVFSCTFIVIGLVMIGITAARGGGIGFVIGALFAALGAGRLKLALRKPSGPGGSAGGGKDGRRGT